MIKVRNHRYKDETAVVMMSFADGRDDHYPRGAGRLRTGKLKKNKNKKTSTPKASMET